MSELPIKSITHRQAVLRIAKWMRFSKGYTVVLTELATKNSETPDVLGFHGYGSSTLVECKVSRSDFLADKNKVFRKDEAQGVGDVRYFAAPPGIIEVDELPQGWGLLTIHPRGVFEDAEPSNKAANKKAEVIMLMSAIRRLEISTAVFVRAESELELAAQPHDPQP